MTLQNGTCLYAARLRCTALDKWPLKNITTSSLVLPDHPARFEDALCIVHMTVLQVCVRLRNRHIYALINILGRQQMIPFSSGIQIRAQFDRSHRIVSHSVQTINSQVSRLLHKGFCDLLI
jgi:hypothetical protein